MSDLLDSPWVYRKMKEHYAIESPSAGGVRVAEVRHIGRPDGSTSEREANAIAMLPELVAAAEGLLHEVGFGRIILETPASERMRSALAATRRK